MDYESFSSFIWSRIFTIKNCKNGNKDGKTLRSRWTRSWWSCSLEHNMPASGEGIRKKTWTKMYTRRLDSLLSARQQQNEIRMLLEFTERTGVHSSTLGTLVVQQFNRNWWIHVLIPYNWKDFIYHRGSVYNQVSITKSGPVKESKEGRRTVFFTPLDPFGSDAHEQEEPSEDYSRPRKVHCHSHWRNDHNAVYWVELSRAQDLRLQFGQTKYCTSISAIPVYRQSCSR